MKNICIIFLTLLFSGTVQSHCQEKKENASGSLKVLSFNIRYKNTRDGKNQWKFRRDDVAKVISNHDCDVVGLQEVLKVQLDDMLEKLTEYSSIGVGRDDGKTRGEYSPILFKKEKFELLESKTKWLSKTPDVVGSKNWDAAITRIVTIAKLKEKSSGKVFTFLNTHFDHRGNQARIESSKLIRNWVDEVASEGPVIVTGDFNARPDGKPIQTMLSKDKEVGKTVLLDSRTASKNEPEGPDSTWCGFSEVIPKQRIDYVFVTENVKVINHRTIVDRVESDKSRFPSDHLPVFSEVSF